VAGAAVVVGDEELSDPEPSDELDVFGEPKPEASSQS
jgi:hypothetical protein